MGYGSGVRPENGKGKKDKKDKPAPKPVEQPTEEPTPTEEG